MALKFVDSPAHVTRDEETVSKMAMKMDLSIFITEHIKNLNLKQREAAEKLNVNQSRISELATGKVEKFSIDAMIDMLYKLGFSICIKLPSDTKTAAPQIAISQRRKGRAISN